jgi:hypothetical protein
MPPLSFADQCHDILRMKLSIAAASAMILLLAATAARADQCNSSDAQILARQGYAYLDQQRWSDARTSAGELALYAKNCTDPAVGVPSVVHSAYIGAVALYHLGDNAKASQAAQLGLNVLTILHKQGGYEDLYNALAPKFAALQSQLKSQ